MRSSGRCRVAAIAAIASLVAQFAVAAPPLPAKVDLTPEFQKLGIPAHLQGDTDVCSLFAVTGVADFEKRPAFARPAGVPLRGVPDLGGKEATGKTHDQAMFYEAVCGLNALGLCEESLMPYVPKSDSRQPSAKALADAGSARSVGRCIGYGAGT